MTLQSLHAIGFLAFWLSGFLAFWLSGFLAFWLSGFLTFGVCAAKSAMAALMALMALMALVALVADVSININQPGVHKRVDVDQPIPQPVIVTQPPRAWQRQAIYL